MTKSTVIAALLISILVIALAGCASIDQDDSGPEDRPVPTPAPTETEAAEPDPTAVPSPVGDDHWYELVISEKTYPETEIGENILELAEDPDEFAELWAWFGFDDDAPVLDWDSRVVLFAGTGESSGCPLVLDAVKFDEEHRFIGVAASRDVPEDTMCTMDWTPRVFVISLNADLLGDGELRAAIYDTEIIDQFDPADGTIIREGVDR